MNLRGSLFLSEEEVKQESNHDVSEVLPNVPFPRATVKRFFSRHVVKKTTRVSEDAVDLMNRVFDEVGGWIVRESERMAANGGKSTIGADHVRGAVELYLGWEEGKVEK
jgi:histone H3/H4